MSPQEIISLAREVLKIEADSLVEVMEKVDESFVEAVRLLRETKGKVVLTGMGKSGLIGKKIAATLASTGTPAFFVHPAEAIHGDLGMLMSEDCLVVLSNSGETPEIVSLLPTVKRMGVKIIALLGRKDSTISRHADVVIDVGVSREACPLGVAPTSSTTAALAVGDALAVVLLKEKGFSLEDFAMLHPGGALGRRLKLVSDIMHRGDEIPLVRPETLLKDVLYEISSKRLGITGVVDEEGKLIGVITDGDLRRAMEREVDVYNSKAADIMTTNPKKIRESELAAKALEMMERFKITSLFVFDDSMENLVGIVHIHDLLGSKVT
ncbi:MAG: KpsF/GutQ family sugar-phosphate isomerase [Deltaproteobacteria bacterium]|nr:MAG: KpsF/GutQ family sugar-phosphate isomerase [Deltaproteobacteria bacterium]